MCLAIPAKIEVIQDQQAVVAIGGVRRTVSLSLTPEARVGQYVVLHTGYAIRVVDENEALESLRLLHELAESRPPGE